MSFLGALRRIEKKVVLHAQLPEFDRLLPEQPDQRQLSSASKQYCLGNFYFPLLLVAFAKIIVERILVLLPSIIEPGFFSVRRRDRQPHKPRICIEICIKNNIVFDSSVCFTLICLVEN